MSNETTAHAGRTPWVGPIVARFAAMVPDRVPGLCWPWMGAVGREGYGRFRLNGRAQLAHRVSWALARGGVTAPGIFVCHRCDNRTCVNPDHLFLGTQDANMRDMVLKGRQVRGAAHPCVKLTLSLVADARQRVAAGESIGSLAREHGVSSSTMWHAVKGRNWKHV